MSYENGEKTCGNRQEIEERGKERKDEREEKETRHEGGKRE